MPYLCCEASHDAQPNAGSGSRDYSHLALQPPAAARQDRGQLHSMGTRGACSRRRRRLCLQDARQPWCRPDWRIDMNSAMQCTGKDPKGLRACTSLPRSSTCLLGGCGALVADSKLPRASLIAVRGPNKPCISFLPAAFMPSVAQCFQTIPSELPTSPRCLDVQPIACRPLRRTRLAPSRLPVPPLQAQPLAALPTSVPRS